MTENAAAETIAEDLLYLTGKSILEGDDAMFIDCITLPQMMDTSKGYRMITTEAEVVEILSGVRTYRADNGFTDLVRTVVSATFLDADTVEATHVSLMVGEGKETKRSPYPVHTVIRRVGSGWKLQSSTYAILDSDDHIDALSGGKKVEPD
jgi:hypothetical protein